MACPIGLCFGQGGVPLFGQRRRVIVIDRKEPGNDPGCQGRHFNLERMIIEPCIHERLEFLFAVSHFGGKPGQRLPRCTNILDRIDA